MLLLDMSVLGHFALARKPRGVAGISLPPRQPMPKKAQQK
jgi:hypothetical protein